MSSRLFGRAWRVQVGAVVLSASSLACRFKIKRTLAARAGTCELEVFNLNADHRHELANRGTLVEVSAGYLETGAALLFRGDVRRASVVRENLDWTLKITAGDGEHAIRTARVSRSFGPDTTLSTVLAALADAMGVGRGNVSTAAAAAALGPVGSAFPAGTVLHGQAAREMTRLCSSAGLEWSVQDGVLQLLTRGQGLQRTAVRLTSSTGLVGSPEVGKAGVVKVKALLIPGLSPGQLVALEASGVSGQYRIETAEYTGDTHGADWFADLVCREQRT